MKADPVFFFPHCQLINISSERGIPPEMRNPPYFNLQKSRESHRKQYKYRRNLPQKLANTESISASFYYILTPEWGLVFKRQLNGCCISIKLLQVVKGSLLRKKYVDNHITWN